MRASSQLLTRRAFAGLGTAWLAAASAAGAQPAAQPLRLRVETAPDEDSVACLYAQESGIFRRLGLDVELQASRSGSAIASAVVGGAVDVGKSSLTGLITAHVRGVPFVLIAPAALYDSAAPVTGTVVRAGSALRTPRDLDGKTVSVQSLKGQMQIATMAWIDDHGGDSSSVQFVELPPPSVLPALEAGRIDAATCANPTLSELLASKSARLLGWSSDSMGKHYLLAAYFCTAAFAAKNPEVILRFARGIAQGAAYTNGHRAQTIPLVARFTSIAPETIARMTRVTCAQTLDPRDIQPVVDASVRYKLIPAAFDARDLIDPAILKASG